MADAAIHGHEHHKPGFFTRWFMSTNHKDIGILYLFVGGFVGLISVLFTVYMRLELMEPGVQYMCQEGARFIASADVCTPNGHLWNVMITYHGVLMMFFVVIPIAALLTLEAVRSVKRWEVGDEPPGTVVDGVRRDDA